MKKMMIAILVIGVSTLFALSGCSQNNSVSTAQPVATAVFTASSSTGDDATAVSTASSSTGDDATMIAMILDKLLGHHSIDIVLSAQHTREEWNVTLDRMIARGAPINEEEKKVIIDWLVSRNK